MSQPVNILNIVILQKPPNSSEDQVANVCTIDPYYVEPDLSAAVRLGHLYLCSQDVCRCRMLFY